MCKLVSCEFNIDTACVELLFADSSMISIDCIAVENEVADDRFDCAELDWLIYNKPMEYADLVLNGGIEEYCKSSREHSSIPCSISPFFRLSACAICERFLQASCRTSSIPLLIPANRKSRWL